MVDEQNSRAMHSKLSFVALFVPLVFAAACLGYVVNQLLSPSSVTSGNLQVTYMLITLKSVATEEASGGTLNVSRVQYFPTYVLVTTTEGTTHLWPVDRLKKFEVSRAK